MVVFSVFSVFSIQSVCNRAVWLRAPPCFDIFVVSSVEFQFCVFQFYVPQIRIFILLHPHLESPPTLESPTTLKSLPTLDLHPHLISTHLHLNLHPPTLESPPTVKYPTSNFYPHLIILNHYPLNKFTPIKPPKILISTCKPLTCILKNDMSMNMK